MTKLILPTDYGTKATLEENGDHLVLVQETDLTHALELIKRERNEADHSIGRKNGMYKAATVPMKVLIYWGEKYNFDPFDGSEETGDMIRKILNDPDNAAFRIWGGKM